MTPEENNILPGAVIVVDAQVEPGLSAIKELVGCPHHDLLKEFVKIVERLGGFSKLLRVDSDARLAAGTSKTTVRFQPSELLLNFLAAIRAIDRDLHIVEHEPSDPPILEGHYSSQEKVFLDFIRHNPKTIRLALGL